MCSDITKCLNPWQHYSKCIFRNTQNKVALNTTTPLHLISKWYCRLISFFVELNKHKNIHDMYLHRFIEFVWNYLYFYNNIWMRMVGFHTGFPAVTHNIKLLTETIMDKLNRPSTYHLVLF
jgi:hypothetical protein